MLLKFAGTFFWSSNVVYSGTVNTANDGPGELEVQEERSEPDNTDNEDMIRNVRITEEVKKMINCENSFPTEIIFGKGTHNEVGAQHYNRMCPPETS